MNLPGLLVFRFLTIVLKTINNYDHKMDRKNEQGTIDLAKKQKKRKKRKQGTRRDLPKNSRLRANPNSRAFFLKDKTFMSK